ncbi:MAG: hypothetical protein GC202_02250 [Alphaproteobacteria bacterium]|nr:hypothetical protein [Alphaproteobacteria bacterium]
MGAGKSTRPKGEARNPILEQVLSDNSSVVLDVAKRRLRTPDIKPLFACRSLNDTIIFKMPNFEEREARGVSDDDDWNLTAQLQSKPVTTDRPIETGIFIPYSQEDREAGGVILYVRQKNFEALMREFLGLNYKESEGPTKRDKEILQCIDSVPSLDPFLLKQALQKSFSDIDRAYFDISDAEDASIRETISRKVSPIVRKALEGNAGTNSALETFVNAIWNPSAPEAALFVSAFGISASQTQDTFEAWRGISYYEWSYARVVRPISRLLGWFQSEIARPLDGQRAGPAIRQQVEQLRVSVGRKLSENAREPDRFFKNYALRHSEFIDKNDPSGFREFLRTARDNYWQLGWSITCLMHVIGIFSRAMSRGTGGQLDSDALFALYRDLDLAMQKKQSVPGTA